MLPSASSYYSSTKSFFFFNCDCDVTPDLQGELLFSKAYFSRPEVSLFASFVCMAYACAAFDTNSVLETSFVLQLNVSCLCFAFH